MSINPTINLAKLALFPLSILFLLLPLTFTANAALSATTALTIEGSKPYLLLSDGQTRLTTLDELLGFSMWDGTYNDDGSKHMVQITSAQSTTDGGSALTVPAGTRYSDVITLVTANNTNNAVSDVLLVGDSDGDATIPANTSVTGTMRATWRNGGEIVSPTNLGSTLSVCGGPYTLEISANNVQANTTYGDPKENNYGSSSVKTYTFTANSPGICYLKPQDLTTYPDQDVSIPNGYNADKFDLTNGFRVNSGFPTTGFAGARFSLIGSGNDQRLFRCTSGNAGTGTDREILLSGASSQALGANCTVTYKTDAGHQQRPTRDITIIMEARSTPSSSDWTQIDSFTIPTPTNWAIGKGNMLYANSSLDEATIYPALSACSGQTINNQTVINKANYMYRRNELTNSPYANIAEGTGTSVGDGGRFSRDADGTFMGEWGRVSNYSGSGWAGVNQDFYWAVEAYSWVDQFLVGTHGGISMNTPIGSFGVMCRG